MPNVTIKISVSDGQSKMVVKKRGVCVICFGSSVEWSSPLVQWLAACSHPRGSRVQVPMPQRHHPQRKASEVLFVVEPIGGFSV